MHRISVLLLLLVCPFILSCNSTGAVTSASVADGVSGGADRDDGDADPRNNADEGGEAGDGAPPGDSCENHAGGCPGDADAEAGDAGEDDSVLEAGCLEPDKRPASREPSGFYMPDLEDERAAYRRWGWTWAAGAEPNVPAEPGFVVVDPDIHRDSEGDDLWSYGLMYRRTGEPGYLSRAQAWARYFKEDYASCVGGEYSSYCFDWEQYGGCHTWGWGLVSWYSMMKDEAALAAAEIIAGQVEGYYENNSCLEAGCTYYGVRAMGRHLLLVLRVAEVTGKPRWLSLRDVLIDALMVSSEWDETLGMYFLGDWGTDESAGAGAYAAGARIQSSFQIGVLSEALDHAYRVTGRAELRRRLVAMAEFVYRHGLDEEIQYTGGRFGVVDGQTWHDYALFQPVTWWDPVYTTSLVNTLMRGYRYTCSTRYFQRAKLHFDRGNRGIYGEAVRQRTPSGEVHHFVDTTFGPGRDYLGYNKGELQYTYLLFHPDNP